MSALKSIRNVFSSKNGKSKLKDIDYQMSESEKREKRTLRLLLLGPGDSGKSTIVKIMKMIHNALDQQELHLASGQIQQAVVTYMRVLCFQCRKLAEQADEKTDVRDDNEPLRRQILALRAPYKLNHELASKISKLWADPAIKKTLELRSKFQIHDNVAYFLDQVADIAHPKYSPSFEDYIRFRSRSTGFVTEKLTSEIEKFGQYYLEFTHVGGQRSERKKWMRIMVDQIDAVLYVVALSEYDLSCFEDDKTNRMHEALKLFEQLVGTNFFEGKSVIILLNKYDLFKEKIATVPITVAFDDYPEDKDPHGIDDVVQFIAGKFLQCFDKKQVKLTSPLHVHRTYAFDTDLVSKVFRAIMLDIVKSSATNPKEAGLI